MKPASEVAREKTMELYDCVMKGHSACVVNKFEAAIIQARREVAEFAEQNLKEIAAIARQEQQMPSWLAATAFSIIEKRALEVLDLSSLPLEPEKDDG